MNRWKNKELNTYIYKENKHLKYFLFALTEGKINIDSKYLKQLKNNININNNSASFPWLEEGYIIFSNILFLNKKNI